MRDEAEASLQPRPASREIVVLREPLRRLGVLLVATLSRFLHIFSYWVKVVREVHTKITTFSIVEETAAPQ